ncbi:MAG: hypothetical protein WKG01_36805 [Kofleriaceae bacterium]
MVRLLAIVILLAGACGGGGDKECAGEVGHDEDGDGRDDGCDPCPFADDNELDEDGDGITGVCDPDPVTKNTVLKFAGFGGEDVELTIAAARPGRLVSRARQRRRRRGAVGSNVDRVWVVAGVTVDAIDASGFREVGVVVDATTVADVAERHVLLDRRDRRAAARHRLHQHVRAAAACCRRATRRSGHYLSGLAGRDPGVARPRPACVAVVRVRRAGEPRDHRRYTPAPAAGQVGVFGFAVDASSASFTCSAQ